MTSTVLPSMALSIASCTRCSLSASRALIAWKGEGGRQREEGERHRVMRRERS